LRPQVIDLTGGLPDPSDVGRQGLSPAMWAQVPLQV
jgi:hypothetical protein